MPYKKQDFLQDVAREQVKELSLKELLDIRGVDGLSAEATRQSLEKAVRKSTTETKQKPQSPRKPRASRQTSK